jgi:hypothetical protein
MEVELLKLKASEELYSVLLVRSWKSTRSGLTRSSPCCIENYFQRILVMDDLSLNTRSKIQVHVKMAQRASIKCNELSIAFKSLCRRFCLSLGIAFNPKSQNHQVTVIATFGSSMPSQPSFSDGYPSHSIPVPPPPCHTCRDHDPSHSTSPHQILYPHIQH